jgi:hypothetical protein
MALGMPLLEQRVSDQSERLLAVLAQAQLRESELEAAYAEDRATAAQLQELEQVRMQIEHCLGVLEGMGYFDPS